MTNDKSEQPLIPDDFQAALSLNETASELFAALPPSHKKEYLNHINGAETPDARMRRIDQAVAAIAAKQKYGAWRPMSGSPPEGVGDPRT